MNTILDTIIASKRKEVEQLKMITTLSELEKRAERFPVQSYSLAKNLQDGKTTGIIAEFKRRSPSKGWFTAPDFEIENVVQDYARGGATAISVLTDEPYFGGNALDLEKAKAVTQVPLLRKDFMIDPIQIAQSKAMGADVILLIAACLKPATVRSLAHYATELGMEVLLELHEESELAHVGDDTKIIGINNRDLKTFSVDIERSLRFSEKLPHDAIKVAESGISSIENIRLFADHGFKGFLIGENFMKTHNPGQAFITFADALRKNETL